MQTPASSKLHIWSNLALQFTLLKAPLKHLLKGIFVPPDRRFQSRKLPLPLHLPIIMLIRRVTVSPQLHLCKGLVLIHLMSSPQLVIPDDQVIRDFDPTSSADEMLSLDTGITEEVRGGGHGEVVGGREGWPAKLADRGVVD